MKNKTDLELSKAFAELEGVDVVIQNGALICDSPADVLSSVLSDKYNPITDVALNCAARDKYRVSVNHYDQFDRGVDGNGSHDIPCCTVSIMGLTGDYEVSLFNVDESLIPKAVIECILKAN